jgi:hypothetical protein
MTGWLMVNGILSVGLLLLTVGMLAWAIGSDHGAVRRRTSAPERRPHYPRLPYRSRELRS